MNFELRHPKDQIVEVMRRIYRGEMTTLSGGNLSILDENGDIWITPAGIDKGKLSASDIIRIKPDGEAIGAHRPSSELPFHRAIYQARSDFRAVVHCHPPALIAYSISGDVPDTRIIPQANYVCGRVGFAPYALPGSERLGRMIARTFAQGPNLVMLENHGVVAGGESLLQAFQRMETLDFCARALINAKILGDYKILSPEQLAKFTSRQVKLPEYQLKNHSSKERDLRQKMVDIAHRACERQLMVSTEGVISARLNSNSFLITPTAFDRQALEIQDIVRVEDLHRESGKNPSRSVLLHHQIYALHPEIDSIITAQSPSAVAYAVTPTPFDSRAIPESYMMLRVVKRVSFDMLYDVPSDIARAITPKSPVLLIQNDCVLTTGKSVLQAFDRLEVLEYTARALLEMPQLGGLKPIDEDRIQDIESMFFE